MASDDETGTSSVLGSPRASPIPSRRTSENDGNYLGPTCHVQRPENRFGSHVLEDIKNFVFEDMHNSNAMDLDDDDDEEEEEEDEEDDDDDLEPVLLAQQFQPQATTLGQFLANVGVDEAPPIDEAHVQTQGPTDHAEMAPEFHGQSQQGFPRVSRLRCNLTALSQRYNLYFAAYQDKIYVYQPKAPPEILPPPSIILQPRRTKAGKVFGGTIDRVFPHQINQMVVGNLGNLEVMLFAMDDGDVGAYYVHTIVRAIISNSEQRQAPGAPVPRIVIPKQFFSENVGVSAWGVAVHEKSRLLAVGSNRHEVTVFAFAVSNSSGQAGPSESELDSSPKVWSGQSALELERHFKSRTRTWRIVLPVGQSGHNIPAIAFVDNEAGEADKVIAVDVHDNTWILDIWKIGSSPVLCTGSTGRTMGHQRCLGWSVLVLPDSSFMHTKTVRESLGLPGNEVYPIIVGKRGGTPYDRGNDIWLDTTCGLYYIKDLAPDPEQVLRSRYGSSYTKLHANGYSESAGSEIEDDFEEDDDTEMSDSPSGSESPDVLQHKSGADEKDTSSKRWAAVTKGPGPKGSIIDDLENEVHLSRAIIPSFGQTPPLDGSFGTLLDLLNGAMQRKTNTRCVVFSDAQFSAYITKNLSIMRTTTTDIELKHFDSSAASIQCKSVLTYHNHLNRRVQPYDMAAHISERVSMLIHVPELNLVVAGALNGRVALITLTKTRGSVHGHALRRGFRVDHVLPRKSEEEKRMRPWCALHGIAMSPVPGRNTKGLELRDWKRGPVIPTKWRLILHYMDHTILMYDIEKRGEDVFIF